MYEVEDVVATLFHGLQTKQHLLVIQTAKELQNSQEDELLVNVVIMAWLLCDPYTCSLSTPPSTETVYTCLCELIDQFPSQLPKYEKQRSVSTPLIVHYSSTDKQNAALDAAVQTCFEKKYAKQCIRILTMLLHKDPNHMKHVFETQGISNTYLDLFDRIMYTPLAERLVQHLVIQRMFASPVSTNKYNQKYSSIWMDAYKQGISARSFQIPFHALAQWNIMPKLQNRIQNTLLPDAIMDKNASLYWQNSNMSYKTLDNDLEIETWYTTHFPDDIPDEWSRDEIEKSHVYIPPEKQQKSQKPDNDWQPAFLLCWS
jgi:hypothetical protein